MLIQGAESPNSLETSVESILSLWRSLDMRKRVIILGATVAVFFAVLGLSRLANTPTMALLYAGLESSAAGDVVAALETAGVGYEVRGDSIYVDETARDGLRMSLASEGLPANGGSGYELLDGLSGFGTTSQMFDATYWRAKEGELARTIMASPQIRSARVHIAQAPSEPFQRNIKPTASISVTSRATITEEQARGVRHLIAASVPGMASQDVTVIDASTGLVLSGAEENRPSAVADTKAQEIKHNIERLLEARVGQGKAIVEVSVDVVSQSETISERLLDPQGRVAISSDTEQSSGSDQGQGGAVTVASNLPEGAASGAGGAKSENSKSREMLNFEVSETQRNVVKTPGDIKRVSVAVLIDGQTVTATDGTQTTTPRPEEELVVLRELVTSAAGLDTARGDVLTMKSLNFQPIILIDAAPPTGVFAALFGTLNLMEIIKVVTLSVVALVLGLFVIRPILMSSPKRERRLALPGMQLALPGTNAGSGQTIALTGEIDDGRAVTRLAQTQAASVTNEMDPVARLRRLIDERQDESLEILRGWMEPQEERI